MLTLLVKVVFSEWWREVRWAMQYCMFYITLKVNVIFMDFSLHGAHRRWTWVLFSCCALSSYYVVLFMWLCLYILFHSCLWPCSALYLCLISSEPCFYFLNFLCWVYSGFVFDHGSLIALPACVMTHTMTLLIMIHGLPQVRNKLEYFISLNVKLIWLKK